MSPFSWSRSERSIISRILQLKLHLQFRPSYRNPLLPSWKMVYLHQDTLLRMWVPQIEEHQSFDIFSMSYPRISQPMMNIPCQHIF